MRIQTSFNAGEFSPLLAGHIDAPQRQNALKTCHNLIALKQGPVTRRSGTKFVAPVKFPYLKTALLHFEFNVNQAYVIEVGDGYMRFYHHHGMVLGSDGFPYEIASPYVQDQLWDAQGICQIRAVQSADILYLTHPNHPPLMLMRLDHNHWQIQSFVSEDGPYLNQNESDITLTPSHITGEITVTASAPLFTVTDIGRHLRIGYKHQWGYGIITGFNHAASVLVQLKSTLAQTSATLEWRLGVWSQTTGYPTCATFYQDRLFFAGVASSPQRIDGSCSGDFMRFAPSENDGTIADDHAVSMVLNSDTINIIRWLIGHEKGLLVGSLGAEWLVSSNSQTKAISPSSIQAIRLSSLGTSNIAPIVLGGSVAFVQRARHKLYLLGFMFEVDGFKTPDLTLFAEHLTQTSLIQILWQQEPYGTLWALRQDGMLLGLTYEPDQHVAAWHKHTIGGVSDDKNNAARIDAMAVVPGYEETPQELWLIVERLINGKTQRYIEYINPLWEEEGKTARSAYLDSCISYEGTPTLILHGLDHLEGQTIGVFSEGAMLHDNIVKNGSLTLERSCTNVEVGLKYRWCLETLPQDTIDSETGTLSPPDRTNHISLRLLNSLGIAYGASLSNTDELILNNPHYGEAPILFTGDTEKLPWPAGYTTHNQIVLTHDGPYPVTILAMMAQS